MSQIMEFYEGDADAIIRGVTIGGLRAIRGAATCPVMAGFYNVSLTDLDLLTSEACRLLGEEPIDFSGTLVEVAVENGGMGGACYVVSPRSVERFAQIPDGSIDLLARRWITALADEHPNDAMDEDELGRGVHDLIEICRKAVDHESDVIFVWT